jgi:Uncharacterized MobA-related protein
VCWKAWVFSIKNNNVAILIMAAGGSSRLDSPKQLLKWGNDFLVNHVVNTALEAGVGPIKLVLGCHSEEILKVLSKKDIAVLINPDWQNGMSSSIKAGIASLDEDVDAALIMLVDQPFVSVDLLRLLAVKIGEKEIEIAAPRVAGQQCNPVAFKRSLFSEIMKISGDHGAKAMLKGRRIGCVNWPDERLALDIDSLEDYQIALRLKEV